MTIPSNVCTPCQFGEHSDEPHTWMESEDFDHEGTGRPASPDDWARLATERPCGCRCNMVLERWKAHRCATCRYLGPFVDEYEHTGCIGQLQPVTLLVVPRSGPDGAA